VAPEVESPASDVVEKPAEEKKDQENTQTQEQQPPAEDSVKVESDPSADPAVKTEE